MERLLADAQELSGVEYNIDNLGDVYEAIHVIQEDLGLTGVAADEAAGTFSGSMGAMKAAAENLMANLALGEDITEPLTQLVGNAEAFLINNLLPMLANIFQSIPELLSFTISTAVSEMKLIGDNADQIVAQGLELATNIATGVIEGVPVLLEAGLELIVALGNALLNADWATAGNNILTALKNSISSLSGSVLGQDKSVVQGFMQGITSSLPQVLQSGVQIITQLVNGILQQLPQMITVAGNVINQFVGFCLQNAPTLISAGADLLLNLVTGIANNLPQIVASAMNVIIDFYTTILDNLPQILQAGVELIIKLAAGIISAIPQVIIAIAEINLRIWEAIVTYDWLSLGANILKGIGNGITSGTESLINALWGSVDAAIKWVMSKLGIKSPSKLMADLVGKNMALGIGEGFEDYMPYNEIETAIKTTVDSAESAADSGIQIDTPSTNQIDYSAIYEAVKEGAEAAHLAILLDGRELTRTLKGLGVSMA